MRFDDPSTLEQILWTARIADLSRGNDRAILQRLYNGMPPFQEDTAEENGIQVNRNDLSGVNLLSQARRQWNQAFLKPGNFFTVTLDSGPVQKRTEWGHTITREINRRLKRNRGMMEQIRATGANVMLHGIGPVMWKDRRSPIPVPISISGLLIPSETDIDFENLEWFAVFREWTPSQLYEMTHGPKVDPGWNMPMVQNRLKEVGEQTTKSFNSPAHQYMPERIEEAIKQNKGFWNSDAVPTIDVWDVYFREQEDGNGWHRRILLDWGLSTNQLNTFSKDGKPDSKNKLGEKDVFLYSSGKRKFANSLSEILHCQFGDCSAVAPFKYHSVRSLGWMLWGVCDLNNQLYCKSMENAFEQLMWFFRTASDADLRRLRKVSFQHMGVIPQGISILTAQERFKPDFQIVEGAFARNRALMKESAASYTQDYTNTSDRASQTTKTATQVMAEVNSVNALVSGMLSLAYTYEEYKYREISRRFCIKDNPDKDVREFRKSCLNAGVPTEMLDVERWDINAERTLGAGNKTLELSIVQGLQSVRKQLSPDAQRRVDHKYIEALTDDPAIAEDLAPIEGEKKISVSTHDAQLSAERLLAGLPYTLPKGAVVEDFVIVWLNDLATVIATATKTGNVAEVEEVAGMMNMASHIANLLQQLSSDDEMKDKVRAYQQQLSQLANLIKGFSQRISEQKQAENGNGGIDPETQVKLQGKQLLDQAKAAATAAKTSQKMAFDQVRFEADEARKDRQANADLRRQGNEAYHGALSTLMENTAESVAPPKTIPPNTP